ncbi:AraC family transcriptional regulator [Paenibacillus agaridevorans]|uniref:AraC family transcriptional regulator n=1 Tax=Paenibacillus agaridevorans TaxID=171404 RepID=A0A2R5EQP3_9BACL|nr:AraC family transcriptional regulator [Paenibacillus agaridevorans]GBG05741.1 AraC family transcriptional regulator [Paenibacillus agaridevorans]
MSQFAIQDVMCSAYAEDNVRFFDFNKEMVDGLPFKIYRISESYPKLGDHKHNYVQIWYIKKGHLVHTMYNEQVELVPGNLFIVPPHIIHRFTILSPQQIEIIGCEFIPQLLTLHKTTKMLFADDDEIYSKITLSGSADIEAQQLLEKMLIEYERKETHYETIIMGKIFHLVGITMRARLNSLQISHPNNRMRHHNIIEKVLSYIDMHYAEELTIEDVTQVAHLSRTVFCDLFKRATNKTFQEYLQATRLSRAMELLLHSNMRIADICYEVGINHPAYFSKIFKKQFGVTPIQYKHKALHSTH